MALEIKNSNFEEVLNGNQPVVLDFWAPWCGPCRAIAPIIDELATEYEGKVVIGKVNVDENPEIAAKYGVRNIPTIVFIKNGTVSDKHVGSASKSAYVEKINVLLQ